MLTKTIIQIQLTNPNYYHIGIGIVYDMIA